ncbi:hypothetical protein M1523_04375 [Patescibacteria group bacterium]|nr:hypothetical protein [Patescibacteria group bacterium]MCL5091776.1 hypothetical protein [Patescibacteria group bacterium]
MRQRKFWPSCRFEWRPVVVVAGVTIGTLVILIKLNAVFSIKKITIVDAQNGQKVIGLSDFQQKNLLLFHVDTGETNLLRNNARLEKVAIVKQYPDQLIIYPVWSTSIAQLKVAAGFFLLDVNGKINLKSKTMIADLPVINYYQLLNYTGYSSSAVIDFSDVKAALFFIDKLRGLGLFANTVDINGADMIALDLGKKQIIFSSEKDANIQWQQWWEIYKQFKVAGKDYRRLDFRYDRPVIEFGN